MKLSIRRMSESDIDAMCRLLGDPDVMKNLEPPFDRAKTEEFMHSAALSDEALIYAAESDGEFIGYVIYHAYDTQSVELGWVLLPECQGRGYASALTDLLLERARRDNKCAVIECLPENGATKHIAKKKGFALCGTRDGLYVYRREL